MAFIDMHDGKRFSKTPNGLPWRPSPPLAPTIDSAGVVGAMTDLLHVQQPHTDAEALRLLRGAFPDYPLATRLAALAHAQRLT